MFLSWSSGAHGSSKPSSCPVLSRRRGQRSSPRRCGAIWRHSRCRTQRHSRAVRSMRISPTSATSRRTSPLSRRVISVTASIWRTRRIPTASYAAICMRSWKWARPISWPNSSTRCANMAARPGMICRSATAHDICSSSFIHTATIGWPIPSPISL